MRVKSLVPTSALYDQDFAAWASETARLLRSGRFGDIDVGHLAEEVEDMANRDKRELRSRLTVLLLEQSPSLKRVVPGSLSRAYRRAVERAALETDLPKSTFPAECPLWAAQILAPDFFPGPRKSELAP
jgi:hypothetical protein